MRRQRFRCSTELLTLPFMGAGLLAKTASYPTKMSADTALSRASPLPQGPSNLQETTMPRFAANLSMLFTEQRSEEHTSELQSLMRISYAVFCLKKKKTKIP